MVSIDVCAVVGDKLFEDSSELGSASFGKGGFSRRQSKDRMKRLDVTG